MPTGYDLLNIHFVNECPKKIQTPLVPSPEFHTSRPQHLTASCSFPSFSTACSLSPSAVITSFHRMYFLSFQQMILFLKCAFFAGIILSSVLLWVPWESMEMLKLSRAQALINQIPFPTRLKQLLSVKIHQVYFCCLLRSWFKLKLYFQNAFHSTETREDVTASSILHFSHIPLISLREPGCNNYSAKPMYVIWISAGWILQTQSSFLRWLFIHGLNSIKESGNSSAVGSHSSLHCYHEMEEGVLSMRRNVLTFREAMENGWRGLTLRSCATVTIWAERAGWTTVLLPPIWASRRLRAYQGNNLSSLTRARSRVPTKVIFFKMLFLFWILERDFIFPCLPHLSVALGTGIFPAAQRERSLFLASGFTDGCREAAKCPWQINCVSRGRGFFPSLFSS